MLVLKNVEYENNDGVTISSGEVLEYGITSKEALQMQIQNKGLIAWSTVEPDGIIMFVSVPIKMYLRRDIIPSGAQRKM